MTLIFVQFSFLIDVKNVDPKNKKTLKMRFLFKRIINVKNVE